jgi:hypothetical protein
MGLFSISFITRRAHSAHRTHGDLSQEPRHRLAITENPVRAHRLRRLKSAIKPLVEPHFAAPAVFDDLPEKSPRQPKVLAKPGSTQP